MYNMDEKTINCFLLCCICKKPLIDPVTANDTRRGCRSCLIGTSSSVTPIDELIVIQMLNDLLVKCLKYEEINIRRGEFDQHEQRVCRQAIIPCKATDIKCPWTGPREQLDKHIDECVFEPLRPALEEIIIENKQLHEKINKLENLLKQ